MSGRRLADLAVRGKSWTDEKRDARQISFLMDVAETPSLIG